MFRRFLSLLCIFLFSFSSFSAAETLTLSFLGDCSIGEMHTQSGDEGSYTHVLDEQGFEWPFSQVRSLLEADDFTFANNELTYTRRKKHQDKPFNLTAAPEYAQVYRFSGIDAVNTVNNHSVDFFVEGYDDTLSALDSVGMQHFGTLYPGTYLARDLLGVYDVRGVRIGAVGISYPQEEDLPLLRYRIRALRREKDCDLVIVSLHWGREEQFLPDSWQFSYARKVIDMGADVIWGHHPHVLQIVQFYQGKPIFYSTGNFTFGSMADDVEKLTGIFQLTYRLQAKGSPELSSFSVIPCEIRETGDYRPVPIADKEKKQKILSRLVYDREIKGMANLPQGFIDSGVVYLEDGILTLESPEPLEALRRDRMVF